MKTWWSHDCRKQHPQLPLAHAALTITTPSAPYVAAPAVARPTCPVCAKTHTLEQCFLGGVNQNRAPWALTPAQQQLYIANAARYGKQPPLPETAQHRDSPAAAYPKLTSQNANRGPIPLAQSTRPPVVNTLESSRAGLGQAF